MKTLIHATTLATILHIAIVGCSSPKANPRKPVHGRVTITDKPIEVGSITFLPVSGGGSPASTSIINGDYHFTIENGPWAGSHKVIIGMETNQAEITRVNNAANSEGISEPGKAIPIIQSKSRQNDRNTPQLPSPPQRTQWETTFDVPNFEAPRGDAYRKNFDLEPLDDFSMISR